MKTQIKNKVGILTGASKGIGKKLAYLCAQEGCHLLISARSEDLLKELQEELCMLGYDVQYVAGDISDPETAKRVVKEAIDHWGQIDFLIHAAGISARGLFVELTPIVMQRLCGVNILGAAYMAQQCLPHITTTHGSIIFISSLAGLRGIPANALYSVSKMAHTAMAETIRAEAVIYNKKIHIGVTYLDVTENDPGKTVLGPTGKKILLKDRGARKVLTQDFVAAKILDGLIHRRKLILPGFFAKCFYFFNRHFPFIVEKVLYLSRGKIKKYIQ